MYKNVILTKELGCSGGLYKCGLGGGMAIFEGLIGWNGFLLIAKVFLGMQEIYARWGEGWGGDRGFWMEVFFKKEKWRGEHCIATEGR